LLPEPIKVVKHVSDSGERMTTLTFPQPFKLPVTHSADRFFADALECPAMLIDSMVWLFIMPWLQNRPEETCKFWLQFNTPAAAQERMRATSGTKSVNWKDERVIIQMVHATRRLFSSKQEEGPIPIAFPFEVTLLCKLGKWVMNAVESDHEAPKRLHALLKDPTAADDKTNRDLTDRNIFEAFATLVAEEQKLPTKKAVRERAFLGSDQNARSVASRTYSDLGLGGLPRG
jgi:hypothetical protein